MKGSNGKQKPERPVVRARSIDTTMREAQKKEVRPEEGREHGEKGRNMVRHRSSERQTRD